MCCQNDKWKGSDVVDCEKNSYAPEGEPLHQIVEEFADNQEAWFKVIDYTYLLYGTSLKSQYFGPESLDTTILRGCFHII